MLLLVDAARGLCHTHFLPPSLGTLGGRALASLLARGAGDFALPGEARLVLAPGLLAHYTDQTFSRLAIASYLPGQPGLRLASAGGAAAAALAKLGFRALLVQGYSAKTGVCDLVIDDTGGSFVPSQSEFCSDLGQRMANLSRKYPEASCLITASRLGRYNVPIASTSISDNQLRPSSHAGNFSGFLLARSGIASIICQRTCTTKAKGQHNEMLRSCLQALASQPAESGAAPACSLVCAKCPVAEGHAGKSKGKWPGYAKYWSCGSPQKDRFFLDRYAALCDQLEIDAFALAQRLTELKQLLPEKRPDLVLRELSSLNENPEASSLLASLQDWLPAPKGNNTSRARLLIDTLGLCRFAQNPHNDPRLLKRLVLELSEQSAEAYRALEEKILLCESPFSSASPR